MMKKNNILGKIFICIILNLIPIALLGLFQISNRIYTILYAIIYIIQSILLFSSLNRNICKISKNFLLLILIVFFNCCMTIFYDVLKFGTIDNNEFLFIISLVFNILIFIVGVNNQEITKEEICKFLKKMCILGIISVIINVMLNYKSMLNILIITNSYNANFSSFFPNRNQFGLFMLIMIISLSLLINMKYEKKYILYFIIFILNLILSMSRNSILGLVVFFIMFFYYKYIKERKKITANKLFLYYLGIIVIIILIFIFFNNTKVYKIINNLFIRADSLENGSGRFDVWKNGILIFLQYNPLFGVGRYKALELNKILYGSNLEYFHSLYIEKIAEHGIVGFISLIYLLRFTWKKVTSSNINENLKIVLKSAIVSFCFFSIFETTTRFSIGYADTMYLIFFFTIPILISNLKSDKID